MSTRRLGTPSSLPRQLTHGTLPWNGDHQRRALLYKFSPGFQAYSAGAHEIAYPAYIEDEGRGTRGDGGTLRTEKLTMAAWPSARGTPRPHSTGGSR